MTDWLNGTGAVRRMPRLWVEQLWLLASREPLIETRSVTFRPGVNVVWAQEPDTEEGTGLSRAGHGVGKTSLCLLLRCVLGDEATVIGTLREKAAANFPKGGVAAKIHIDGAVWFVFRAYGSHSAPVAKQCMQLVDLWREDSGNEHASYLTSLQQSFMSKLAMRTLPGTGQQLEWRHLLAWCIREQRTRFDGFFHWREGDGLGFQRSRIDPPLLVRSVLGLVDQINFELMQAIESLESQRKELEKRKEELVRLPVFELEHLTRQLRQKMQVTDEVPLLRSDLFGTASLESKVEEFQSALNAQIKQRETEAADAEKRAQSLMSEVERLLQAWRTCDHERQIKKTLLDNNKDEYDRLMGERERLEKLAGQCKDGKVEFSDCQHIRHWKSTHDFQWAMDAKSRKNDESRRQREWSDATDKAQQTKQALENQQTKLAEQQKAVRQLLIRIATLQLEFQQTAQAWADLQERNRLRDAGEDSLDLIRAKTQSQKLVESLQKKQAQLVQHQLAQSERKANIQRLTALLAERLLGEPGYGRFVADSDHQPFNLSQGGEAYQVLEVLLGDLACLLDGATSTESQHPGFVVHDCPREADMSSILYANFLQAAQEAEVQLAYEGSVPFQYIVTTTSAPPRSMSKEPYAVLTLRPGHKDQLLFKRQLKQGLT